MALVLEEEVWSKHFQSQVNTKWSPMRQQLRSEFLLLSYVGFAYDFSFFPLQHFGWLAVLLMLLKYGNKEWQLLSVECNRTTTSRPHWISRPPIWNSTLLCKTFDHPLWPLQRRGCKDSHKPALSTKWKVIMLGELFHVPFQKIFPSKETQQRCICQKRLKPSSARTQVVKRPWNTSQLCIKLELSDRWSRFYSLAFLRLRKATNWSRSRKCQR